MRHSRFELVDHLIWEDTVETGPDWRSERLQDLWRRLKGLAGGLFYGPVWAGAPTRLADWRTMPVDGERLAAVAGRGRALLPELAARLDALGAPPATGQELARLVHAGLRECAARLAEDAAAGPPAQDHTPAPLPLAAWREGARYKRRTVVEAFIASLDAAPDEVTAVLLHGSSADGRAADGFSDLDVIVVAELPADPGRFEALIDWLLGTSDHLLAFNPCMHHGPWLMWRDELRWTTDAALPVAMLERAVLVHGRLDAIAYRPPLVANALSLQAFEDVFETTVVRPDQIVSAFDALWWISTALLVPMLRHQSETGRSVYKADFFDPANGLLPPDERALFERVGAARLALAAWIDARLPDPVWPPGTGLNPGVCLSHMKNRLALSAADRAGLGLDQALIDGVRSVYERAASGAVLRVLEAAGLDRRPPRHLAGWPRQTHARPRPLAIAAYDRVIQRFRADAAANPDVVALYQFGEIGCPGLSDVDFLAIIRDGRAAVPPELTVARLESEDDRYVLGHDPLFVSEGGARDMDAVFPVFNIGLLAGRPLEVGCTPERPPEVRAAVFTVNNYRKYPRDLLYLVTHDVTDFRTILAFLHSFQHVRRCLEDMEVPVGAAIRACCEADAELRRDFLAGRPPEAAALAPVFDRMLEASAEMLVALQDYWLRRLPFLGDILPARTVAEAHAVILEALARGTADTPEAAPVVTVAAGYLAGADWKPLFPSEAARRIEAEIGGYLALKRSFIERESALGRPPSVYISDPALVYPPPPDGSRPTLARAAEIWRPDFLHFMAECNGFALEHGLATCRDWSAVWEYPWLWFAGLDRHAGPGCRVIDVGGGLSPLPWLLALRGARVTLVETDLQWQPAWMALRDRLGVDLDWIITADERIPLADRSADLVTSLSVLEHQPDPARAVAEAARVLKPGGMFALSFDVCEPDRGMSFPEWNGKALTTAEFERLVWRHPAFATPPEPLDWNFGDCPGFLDWHRRSAPHHTYVVGAAILRKA